MEKICDSLERGEIGKELFELWEEYETQSSPEAKLVKDFDKLEMIIQAYEYEKGFLFMNFFQFNFVCSAKPGIG